MSEIAETSAIAETFQQTNEALSESRRELSEEAARISGDPDLSAAAKARRIDEQKLAAQERYVQIRDQHETAIADRLEANERRLFQLRYPQSAITEPDKENFRQGYRQAAYQLLGASEESISRLLTRALRTGDTVLAQAAYHESIERGLSEVGDEYRAKHPQAARAWEIMFVIDAPQ